MRKGQTAAVVVLLVIVAIALIVIIYILINRPTTTGSVIKEVQQPSINKGMTCENLCKEKGLKSAGYGENQNDSIMTTQRYYSYTCNCLAQPMTLCQSDDDCVKGVGYCDVNHRVCVPIEK